MGRAGLAFGKSGWIMAPAALTAHTTSAACDYGVPALPEGKQREVHLFDASQRTTLSCRRLARLLLFPSHDEGSLSPLEKESIERNVHLFDASSR